jgi:tetratricopeptide (TPR) repeat protein
MNGHFELGFELQPVDRNWLEGLQPESDKFEDNITWKKAQENKAKGNKLFKDGMYSDAVARWSELLMQGRALEQDGVPEEYEKEVRTLMAQAYLNLAAAFLQMGELGHAQNTATRALQGDEDPPNKKHDVLPAASKAKALYRRGQARQQLQNYDLAKKDYEASIELSADSAVKKALAELRALIKEAKGAEKEKLNGFFAKGDAFGPTPEPEDKPDKGKLKDTVKLKDGLFLVPEGTVANPGAVATAMSEAEAQQPTQSGLEEEATAIRARVEAAAAAEGVSAEEFISSLKADDKKAEAFAKGELGAAAH